MLIGGHRKQTPCGCAVLCCLLAILAAYSRTRNLKADGLVAPFKGYPVSCLEGSAGLVLFY